jgi:DNA polymerase
LSKTRTKIAAVRGDLKTARFLFIGEAPSRSEDVLGLPFVGESGKLLDALIIRAGIPLDSCIFTNTVLCRPCDARGGENREPTNDEIFACIGNVTSIVSRIKTLSGVVLAGKISKKYYARVFKSIPSVQIMHPSALYRQGGAASSHYRDALNALKEFYNEITA